MTSKSNMKLLPGLIMGLFSSYASAGGFQLLEQNASGIGNAYAGSAAVAENASTIFYNPAGMTQLREHEFSTGVTTVKTSDKFTDTGSVVGQLAGTGNGGNAGGFGFIPNGYLSWSMDKDLYLGLGFGAPFGLKTKYDNPWLGAAQAKKFDVKTYNVNPSVAYRVSESFSVGAGVSWQRLTAEYTRQVAVQGPVVVIGGNPVVTNVFVNSPLKLNLDDNSWGWNVGGLWTLAPGTKIGASYRSKIKYKLNGDIDVTGPSDAVNASASGGARGSLKLPDTFILSGTHRVSDKWEMLGDVSWTGWSTLQKIDVIRTTGAGTGTIAQTLDTAFRDTWRVALGANYQYNDAVKLKFGIAYDETPVKAAATRLVSLPDNNRVWFSTGAQWTPSKDSTVDFGVAYLYLKDPKINNDQQVAGRGLVAGTYDVSAWIFGLQYSRAF